MRNIFKNRFNILLIAVTFVFSAFSNFSVNAQLFSNTDVYLQNSKNSNFPSGDPVRVLSVSNENGVVALKSGDEVFIKKGNDYLKYLQSNSVNEPTKVGFSLQQSQNPFTSQQLQKIKFRIKKDGDGAINSGDNIYFIGVGVGGALSWGLSSGSRVETGFMSLTRRDDQSVSSKFTIRAVSTSVPVITTGEIVNLPDGSKIAIRSLKGGRYVQVFRGSELFANGSKDSAVAQFTVKRYGDYITLEASNGGNVKALDNFKVVAEPDDKGTGNSYKWRIQKDGDIFYLKSLAMAEKDEDITVAHGYLNYRPDDSLRTHGDSAPWGPATISAEGTKFFIEIIGTAIKYGDTIDLKSFHETYLRAGNTPSTDGGWDVNSNVRAVGDREKWVILSPDGTKTGDAVNYGDKIRLLSSHGGKKYLSARTKEQPGTNESRWDVAQLNDGVYKAAGWENWTIESRENKTGEVKSGDKIDLKSFHNGYLRAGSDKLVNTGGSVGDWEEWTIENFASVTPATPVTPTPTTEATLINSINSATAITIQTIFDNKLKDKTVSDAVKNAFYNKAVEFKENLDSTFLTKVRDSSNLTEAQKNEISVWIKNKTAAPVTPTPVPGVTPMPITLANLTDGTKVVIKCLLNKKWIQVAVNKQLYANADKKNVEAAQFTVKREGNNVSFKASNNNYVRAESNWTVDAVKPSIIKADKWTVEKVGNDFYLKNLKTDGYLNYRGDSISEKGILRTHKDTINQDGTWGPAIEKTAGTKFLIEPAGSVVVPTPGVPALSEVITNDIIDNFYTQALDVKGDPIKLNSLLETTAEWVQKTSSALSAGTEFPKVNWMGEDIPTSDKFKNTLLKFYYPELLEMDVEKEPLKGWLNALEVGPSLTAKYEKAWNDAGINSTKRMAVIADIETKGAELVTSLNNKEVIRGDVDQFKNFIKTKLLSWYEKATPTVTEAKEIALNKLISDITVAQKTVTVIPEPEIALNLPEGFAEIAGKEFIQLSSGLKDGSLELWGVKANGEIWRSEKYTEGRSVMGTVIPSTITWNQPNQEAKATWISVGLGGTVCAVATDKKAYIWDWTNSKWNLLNARADLAKISVGDKDKIWAITEDKTILQFVPQQTQTTTAAMEATSISGDWKAITANDTGIGVAVASDGTVVGINKNGNVYTFDDKKLIGEKWLQMPNVILTQVSVADKDHMYGVYNKELWIYQNGSWSKVKAKDGKDATGFVNVSENLKGDVFVLGGTAVDNNYKIYNKMGTREVAVPVKTEELNIENVEKQINSLDATVWFKADYNSRVVIVNNVKQMAENIVSLLKDGKEIKGLGKFEAFLKENVLSWYQGTSTKEDNETAIEKLIVDINAAKKPTVVTPPVKTAAQIAAAKIAAARKAAAGTGRVRPGRGVVRTR